MDLQQMQLGELAENAQGFTIVEIVNDKWVDASIDTCIRCTWVEYPSANEDTQEHEERTENDDELST